MTADDARFLLLGLALAAVIVTYIAYYWNRRKP